MGKGSYFKCSVRFFLKADPMMVKFREFTVYKYMYAAFET